jgi:hypothetical protein
MRRVSSSHYIQVQLRNLKPQRDMRIRLRWGILKRLLVLDIATASGRLCSRTSHVGWTSGTQFRTREFFQPSGYMPLRCLETCVQVSQTDPPLWSGLLAAAPFDNHPICPLRTSLPCGTRGCGITTSHLHLNIMRIRGRGRLARELPPNTTVHWSFCFLSCWCSRGLP